MTRWFWIYPKSPLRKERKLTTERQIDKNISDLVGALADPIIAYPGGWGETIPEWVKNSITLERLVMNMKALKGEEPTGTDAEAMAYLYSASLTAPMDSDWTEIYLYLAGRVITQNRKTEIPPDIKVESLNEYQQNELRSLKRWLYEARTRARRERDQAERRQQKEEETREKEIVQPPMFKFYND
jgi:hypothetical protein